MLVTRDPNGGAEVAERFLNFARDPLSAGEPLLVPSPTPSDPGSGTTPKEHTP
jgi:hypothetical protein